LWHLADKEEAVGRSSVVADAAASFQSTIVEILVVKTIKAAKEMGVGQIVLTGGVVANKVLAGRFLSSSPIPVVISPPHLCLDNAGMIAACAYSHFQRGQVGGYGLDVAPSLSQG
jgi:N6-L-threonylcarbamoyladenine synthase